MTFVPLFDVIPWRMGWKQLRVESGKRPTGIYCGLGEGWPWLGFTGLEMGEMVRGEGKPGRTGDEEWREEDRCPGFYKVFQFLFHLHLASTTL